MTTSLSSDTNKPASWTCPDCGRAIEPFLKFSKAWHENHECPDCSAIQRHRKDREKAIRFIDNAVAGLDQFLLARGLTPKLLTARHEQFPDKLHTLFAARGGFVYGATGRLKTTLLAALIRKDATDRLTEARIQGRMPDMIAVPFFANVTRLVERLRFASLGQSNEDEYSILQLYNNCPRLVLDDMGERRSTEFFENFLYQIVDTRDNYLRPTFFSSNYSLQDLSKRIQERTASRIAGMVLDRVVFMGGPDRRLLRENTFRERKT